MVRIDPRELGPDEFYLSGRAQIETALDVLATNNTNPTGQILLGTLLTPHAIATSAGSQEDLSVYLQGEEARELKADIGMAATLAEQNHGLSEEQRIAAGGLLDVLGMEK